MGDSASPREDDVAQVRDVEPDDSPLGSANHVHPFTTSNLNAFIFIFETFDS